MKKVFLHFTSIAGLYFQSKIYLGILSNISAHLVIIQKPNCVLMLAVAASNTFHKTGYCIASYKRRTTLEVITLKSDL